MWFITTLGFMEKQILEQEQFSTIKALSTMQGSLSDAKAELIKLKEGKELYLETREKEVYDRITRVLAESREALEQITKNHDELSHYGDDLKAQATDLHLLSTQIVALSQHFRDWMDEETKKLDNGFMALADERMVMRTLSVNIAEDRKQLKHESAKVAEEMRLLIDRRGLLERGFAELKRKQIKYDN